MKKVLLPSVLAYISFMGIPSMFWLVPVSSILALMLALFFYRQMKRESEGTPLMQKIASHVRKGAMSYLRQQYKVVTAVFVCLVILFSIMAYGFGVQNPNIKKKLLNGARSRTFI